MKTSELTGALLDYWVAHGIGHRVRLSSFGAEIIDWNKPGTLVAGKRFQPSTEWEQGGPIIEREKISLIYWPSLGKCEADINLEMAHGTQIRSDFHEEGDTALIAAMRAYVASKFGEEVKDIKEEK